MYDNLWKNKKSWKEYTGLENIPIPSRDREISKAVPLFWREHCVECAIPECYSNCKLYVSRSDQKCARFVYGIFPNKKVKGLFNYGADICFRRWGKIEAVWYGYPKMHSLTTLRMYDYFDRLIGVCTSTIANLFQFVNKKQRINGLYTFFRLKLNKKQFEDKNQQRQNIDGFFIKFFSPGNDSDELQIEFFQDHPVYRGVIPVKPGWNEKCISFHEMNINPNKKGKILLWPSNDMGIRLIFSWLDFVTFKLHDVINDKIIENVPDYKQKPAAKVKCLVWDLDDTLWKGIIGEIGAENVEPRDNAIDLIKKLDQRGIIHSIASKNTYEIAWPRIKELGLADYFLCPAIHWANKSQSLYSIAKELNINLDTVALIDDSHFERDEVKTVFPQVRVYDPKDIDKIPHKDEFDVPITEFSQKRRLSYLSESKRKIVKNTWSGNYDSFLRSCSMQISIGFPRENQKMRCLELLQRTNQLNLSGRRLSQKEFDTLLTCDSIDCYALGCSDKYGDYGIVGFTSIDISGANPRIKDFVLSCRVAQKRLEETFIYWYAKKATMKGVDRLLVDCVLTDRNKPLREVLEKLHFREIAKNETCYTLEFKFGKNINVPDVIDIKEV